MRKYQIVILLGFMVTSCSAKNYTITFKVDMSGVKNVGRVGIRGNVAPLSLEKDFVMTDDDGDGFYESTITFNTSKANVRYRFSNNSEQEMRGADNRIYRFNDQQGVTMHIYNEYNFYGKEKIEKLVYTSDQIKEDVAVLKNTIDFIHPNLYKYRDSIELEQDFVTLEKKLLENPNIISMFGEISKFAAKIKCSHTFTNPWNQGADVKKAIFFQPDKLPLTFDRIGKKIFINKNATESDLIKKGMELISIDNIPAEEIMIRLVAYITSDGNNYEKRLQRLTLSGTSKFELFDIFYPIEFGSKSTFDLELLNHKTMDTIKTKVSAISKTYRNKVLRERYDDFENTFEDGWQFEVLDKKTAHLKIKSFAVFSYDFDWKDYLNNSFKTLKEQKIENLIIDLRENEGGDTEVAEYIVERIISNPINLKIPAQTTRYRKIPDELKKHISTWDNRPYDWGNKVKYVGQGKYELKSTFVPTSKIYKPKKNNFKGSVYMLVGAENSSATHITATYAKKYKLATLIGQETGGNQKGLNGGYIFFLRLPNTRIEIDIPVFGTNIFKDTPETYDGGIRPDILVEKKVSDLINGVDAELQKALSTIGSEH